MNEMNGMYFIETIVFVSSSLIVSEVRDGASRVRNGMPGSCPQVYLHLLYLECNDIEHSRGYRELKLNYMGQTLKPGNFKYTLFAKEIICLIVF